MQLRSKSTRPITDLLFTCETMRSNSTFPHLQILPKAQWCQWKFVLVWEQNSPSDPAMSALTPLAVISHQFKRELTYMWAKVSASWRISPGECHVMSCWCETQTQGCFYCKIWWELLSLNLAFTVKPTDFKNLQNIFMVSMFNATILKATSAVWICFQLKLIKTRRSKQISLKISN